jgi:hypothetical protein
VCAPNSPTRLKAADTGSRAHTASARRTSGRRKCATPNSLPGSSSFIPVRSARSEVAALGLPSANTREADFGVNYWFRDGLKGIFSYGRQFSSAGNANQWSFGLAYRFLIPWAEWGCNREDNLPFNNFAGSAAMLAGRRLRRFRRASLDRKRCTGRDLGISYHRPRRHARRRRAAFSRQLRTLSQCSAEISSAHDVNHSPPHAGAGYDHRRRPASDSVLHDPIATRSPQGCSNND